MRFNDRSDTNWTSSILATLFAVKMLRGKATIIDIFVTNLMIAVASTLAVHFFGLKSLGLLIITVLIYSAMFEMGLVRAFLAWMLQYFIVFILIFVGAVIFGVTSAF